MSDPEFGTDAWFHERWESLMRSLVDESMDEPHKVHRATVAAALEWAADRHLDAGVHASPQHLLRAKAREIREGE